MKDFRKFIKSNNGKLSDNPDDDNYMRAIIIDFGESIKIP